MSGFYERVDLQPACLGAGLDKDHGEEKQSDAPQQDDFAGDDDIDDANSDSFWGGDHLPIISKGVALFYCKLTSSHLLGFPFSQCRKGTGRCRGGGVVLSLCWLLF